MLVTFLNFIARLYAAWWAARDKAIQEYKESLSREVTRQRQSLEEYQLRLEAIKAENRRLQQQFYAIEQRINDKIASIVTSPNAPTLEFDSVPSVPVSPSTDGGHTIQEYAKR